MTSTALRDAEHRARRADLALLRAAGGGAGAGLAGQSPGAQGHPQGGQCTAHEIHSAKKLRVTICFGYILCAK